jgi:hypothetical protein
VTSRNTPSIWRRALGLAICYALALNALFAAYGTAFAVAQPGPEAGFTICHGNGVGELPAPSGDGDTLPCVMCAVAAAAGVLLPEAPVAPAPALSIVTHLGPADAGPIAAVRFARAGLARAPPDLV